MRSEDPSHEVGGGPGHDRFWGTSHASALRAWLPRVAGVGSASKPAGIAVHCRRYSRCPRRSRTAPCCQPVRQEDHEHLGVRAFEVYQVELPPGGSTEQHTHADDGVEDVYAVIHGDGWVVVERAAHRSRSRAILRRRPRGDTLRRSRFPRPRAHRHLCRTLRASALDQQRASCRAPGRPASPSPTSEGRKRNSARHGTGYGRGSWRSH